MKRPTRNWGLADWALPTEDDALEQGVTWAVPRLTGHPLFPEPLTARPGEGMALHQLSAIIAGRFEQVLRVKRLEDRVADLAERVEALEAIGSTVTFFIATFAPEPYLVKKPLSVVIQKNGDAYLASFVEANINSAGDNQQEAYANVRELILDVFDRLSSLPAAKLGPGPLRQIAVLREFVDAAPIDN